MPGWLWARIEPLLPPPPSHPLGSRSGSYCPAHTPRRSSAAWAAGSTAAWRKVRKRVLARGGRACRRCWAWENLDVHHIIPRSQGGSDRPENLITLCGPCHRAEHGGPGVAAPPLLLNGF